MNQQCCPDENCQETPKRPPRAVSGGLRIFCLNHWQIQTKFSKKKHLFFKILSGFATDLVKTSRNPPREVSGGSPDDFGWDNIAGSHGMLFVLLLIDSPKPIELVVVDSHPDVVENALEAINITDFFRLSGQIISESAQRLESGLDRELKMNASSFRLTKNLGIITGKKELLVQT